MPRGKKTQANPNPNPQAQTQPNPQAQTQPNPQAQTQAPVNNNTNTNNGGTTMNTNNNTNTQIPTGVDPTMYMMMTMQQQSQENMLLMIQQMNQNNPNAALLQMVLNNQNNQNNQPLSPVGQTIADMREFRSLLTPSEDALTRAEDMAEAKAREKFDTAYAAYSNALPNLSDAEIRALLKVANVEEPTTTQIELERKKAREEAIAKQAEDFNTSVKAYQSFAATINPNAPVPSPTPAAPVPSPAATPSQRRTFPETISDLMRANAEAKIAWNKTAYNIK